MSGTAQGCAQASPGSTASSAAATCDRSHRAAAQCFRPARCGGPSSTTRWPCGRASLPQFAITQVSLVPPPWDELTTREPSRSATRVNPPGTRLTDLPDNTYGLKSMCRGASPASTKVGQVDRESVG